MFIPKTKVMRLSREKLCYYAIINDCRYINFVHFQADIVYKLTPKIEKMDGEKHRSWKDKKNN